MDIITKVLYYRGRKSPIKTIPEKKEDEEVVPNETNEAKRKKEKTLTSFQSLDQNFYKFGKISKNT